MVDTTGVVCCKASKEESKAEDKERNQTTKPRDAFHWYQRTEGSRAEEIAWIGSLQRSSEKVKSGGHLVKDSKMGALGLHTCIPGASA